MWAPYESEETRARSWPKLIRGQAQQRWSIQLSSHVCVHKLSDYILSVEATSHWFIHALEWKQLAASQFAKSRTRHSSVIHSRVQWMRMLFSLQRHCQAVHARMCDQQNRKMWYIFVTALNNTIRNKSTIFSYFLETTYNFLVFSPKMSYLDGNWPYQWI
jgi:hypothetical protein